jgi:pilus assembly protein CpaE
MTGRETELTALLISPDRELARQITTSLTAAKAFQILADVRSYLPEHALELRLRQMNPDVVLLDLVTDIEQACETIRILSSLRPPTQVIGLHHAKDSHAIVRSLRMGASEFLHSPFEASAQRDAAARIRRLRQPEQTSKQEPASVICFSSTKPGSGASTLATQTAFALRRLTGRRVLLADFDLMGGAIGFYLKVRHHYSLVDALASTEHLDPGVWSAMTVNAGGVDILASPEDPSTSPVDPERLSVVIESARRHYEWIVIDLPVIFHRTSMLTLSECDKGFLVSTSELPSLHLTRRAISMLATLGFDKDRYKVVVNRVNRRDGLAEADLEKMFNHPVYATLPNDYFALHRVVTLGEPLTGDGDLGKAVESLASRLAGKPESEKKRQGHAMDAKPVLSQT